MAYGTYKTLEEVLIKFDIERKAEDFMQELNVVISNDLFDFIKSNLRTDRNYISENSICETIISPILNIIAKQHNLPVWSHIKLDISVEDGLTGIPDFLIAPISKTGVSFTKPIVCVSEVKKENFEEGWAQALSEMIAAQRLNNEPQKTIYGIATSGELWKFGMLIEKQLIVEPRAYSATMDLQRLLNALNWLFEEAKKGLDLSKAA